MTLARVWLHCEFFTVVLSLVPTPFIAQCLFEHCETLLDPFHIFFVAHEFKTIKVWNLAFSCNYVPGFAEIFPEVEIACCYYSAYPCSIVGVVKEADNLLGHRPAVFPYHSYSPAVGGAYQDEWLVD